MRAILGNSTVDSLRIPPSSKALLFSHSDLYFVGCYSIADICSVFTDVISSYLELL